MPAGSGLPRVGFGRSSPPSERSRHREGAERQVDEEQPAPAGMVDDQAADDRAADAGQREDHREVGLVARPLPRRHDFADERLRQRHQAAAAEPLQDPRGDQQAERRRQAAGERAGREHDDGDAEQLAPAEAVAEPAVERHHDHRGQQVADRQPGGLAQAAELAADHRRRGREQRLVDRRQEHRQHDREEEPPEAGAVVGRREGGGLGGVRAGRRSLWQRRFGQRRLRHRFRTDGDVGRDAVARAHALPVEPNPPLPRSLASKLSTMRNTACTTGTTTSWAMRSNGCTV